MSFLGPPPGFYQTQLTVLALYCVGAVFLERYVSQRKAATAATTTDPDDESRRPLNGGILGQSPASAYAALQKSYLIVYAVVMGKRALGISPSSSF